METVELVFEEHGVATNPPLLILHGFFAYSRNWRQIAEKLAQTYHVYTLDARNHGASPHHAIMDYPSMAADVARFIEQHELSTVTLLAHSMGGKTAMWFALTYPHLLEQLIVVDIAPVPYKHSFAPLVQTLQNLSLSELTNRKQADVFLTHAIPDNSYRQFLLQNLVLKSGGYQWRIDLDIFKRNAENVTGFPDTQNVSPFMGKTLFIAGGNSSYIPANSTDALFPTAQTIVISDAEHWIHVQQPEAFLKTVTDFLQI